MDDESRWELDAEGHLVERCVGFRADTVGYQIGHKFREVVKPEDGWVIGQGTGLQVLPNSRRVPRADVGFVSRKRLPDPPAGHLQVTPELLVEVVSPNNKATELASKVQEYLDAGGKLVWVVYPETRTIIVHRATGGGDVLNANDTITGEDILPGFAVQVSELFPD